MKTRLRYTNKFTQPSLHFLAEYFTKSLTDGDGVRESPRDEPLERLEDGLLAGVGPPGELPPVVDVLGVLAQRLQHLLVHRPPT